MNEQNVRDCHGVGGLLDLISSLQDVLKKDQRYQGVRAFSINPDGSFSEHSIKEGDNSRKMKPKSLYELSQNNKKAAVEYGPSKPVWYTLPSKEDNVVYVIDFPGIDPATIDVTLIPMGVESHTKQRQYVLRAVVKGFYEHDVVINGDYNVDGISSTNQNGRLTVNIPNNAKVTVPAIKINVRNG